MMHFAYLVQPVLIVLLAISHVQTQPVNGPQPDQSAPADVIPLENPAQDGVNPPSVPNGPPITPGLGMPMPVEFDNAEADPGWYQNADASEYPDMADYTGEVPVMPVDPHMFVRSPNWVPFSRHAFPHRYPFWDAASKSQMMASSMYQQPMVLSGLASRPWYAPGIEPPHPPDCAMARAQGLPCTLDYLPLLDPSLALDRQDDPIPGVIQYPAYIPSEPGSPPRPEDDEIPATVPIASVPDMAGVHAVLSPGSGPDGMVNKDTGKPDTRSKQEQSGPTMMAPPMPMMPGMAGQPMMTTSMTGQPVMMVPYNPYGGQMMGPPMMIPPPMQGSAQMMAGGMPPGMTMLDSNGLPMTPVFADEGPIRDGEIPGMRVSPEGGPMYWNLFSGKDSYGGMQPIAMQPMPAGPPDSTRPMSAAEEAYAQTGSNTENIDWMLQRPWHLDNEQLELYLFEISRFFNDATRLESLGEDENGTSIYALVICYSRLACQERPVLKPKIRIVAGLHGDHGIPRAIATFLIQYLLTYREVNPRVQRLLEKSEIHIIPAVNSAGWKEAYDTFVAKNRYSNITAGRLNSNDVDLAYDYPGLAHYRNPLDRGFWEGRQRETIALMRYSLEEAFALSGTLASGDTLGVVIPFFGQSQSKPKKRSKTYAQFLNRKKRSDDIHGSFLDIRQAGDGQEVQQVDSQTPTAQPILSVAPPPTPIPQANLAAPVRKEARTPDQDVFFELAKRYSYAHPFMHQVGFACPWRHPRIGQHGVVNGAEFSDFYKLGAADARDGSKRSHAADWHYKYAGTMDLWLYISCYNFGTYQTMESVWDKNVNSLISFMEGVHTGVKGLVWANDTGNPVQNAMIEVKNRRHRARTNHRGEYWRLLNSGVYEVRAFKKGFETCNWHRVVVTNLEGPAILHFHLTRTGENS